LTSAQYDNADSSSALWEQVCAAADAWYDAGYNVLPMKADGSKRPNVKGWKDYETKRVPDGQHERWFHGNAKPHGLAVITGHAESGSPLELFEFETLEVAQKYKAAAEEAGLGDLLAAIGKGYQELSPGGGVHLLWRCAEVGANVLLAGEPYTDEEGQEKVRVFIETRGRGGLAVVAPSGGGTHKTGRPWVLKKGGLDTILEITPDERAALLALAQTFDLRPPPEPYRPKGLKAGERRPGDDFNAAESTRIEELLEEAGWSCGYTRTIDDREVAYWARPEKDPREGISASLGWARDASGGPALWVFSTSTPFDTAHNPFDKFGVYAVLQHGGDFKAAAAALAAEGYGEKTRKPKMSDLLLCIIEEGYDLGRTLGGEDYAVAKEDHGPYIARMIGKKGGGQFRAEIAAKYAAAIGAVPDDTTLRNAMLVVRGKCLAAEPVELGLRVARYGEGSVLDRGDASGRSIVISPDGWETVDRSPVLFRRTKLTQALPEPVRGPYLISKLIRQLRKLILLADPSKYPVLIACQVFILLRPEEPAPVPYFSGEAGATKSHATGAYARLVDPSYPQTRRRPTNERDWVIAAKGSRVVALDNLYGIQEWLQGSMCRAVTGEGDVSRELYSDEELVVMSYRRALAFNGIDVTNLKDDLADRVINFEIPMMHPTKRLKDAAARKMFEDAWPEMLGGLLDLAVRVLRVLPEVKMPKEGWSRMTDFEEVLLGVDRVLHTRGFEAYRQGRKALAVEVLDDRAFTSLLRNRVDAKGGVWQTTCQDMLVTLTNDLHDPFKPPKGWPEEPRAVSNILKSAAPSFRKAGYEIEYLGQIGPKRDRTWRVAKSDNPYGEADKPKPKEDPF